MMTTFSQSFPVVPVPSLPALMAGAKFSQLYSNLPVFPGMPMPSAFDIARGSAFTPQPAQQFSKVPNYTQAELDMLLYGYGISKTSEGGHHALSGLRISELGLDRTVSTGGKLTHRVQTATTDGSALPDGVMIHQSVFAGLHHCSAFTTKPLKKGHVFGPFQGKKVYTSEIKTNDGNSHMWEIFTDGKLQCFIDGRGSNGNWMTYVNCARYIQEQNLNAVQMGDEIFYEACKDIPAGKELLVWYGDTYNLFMGIPVGLKSDMSTESQEKTKLNETQTTNDANGYSCERCGKVFAYKYYKDKHLKYTRCVDQGDRKFPCTLCTRSFEKRDRLRIHILHVHEKHRPHKCTVCNKCFSQSSSLNKHMRVHSGERPYKCVYCNKAFTASSILRTHIRQHSGEKPFKCKFCGKAFASHAAHDSHVRRTHAKDKMTAATDYPLFTGTGEQVPFIPPISNDSNAIIAAKQDYTLARIIPQLHFSGDRLWHKDFHAYGNLCTQLHSSSQSLCASPSYSTMSSTTCSDDGSIIGAAIKRDEIDVVG